MTSCIIFIFYLHVCKGFFSETEPLNTRFAFKMQNLQTQTKYKQTYLPTTVRRILSSSRAKNTIPRISFLDCWSLFLSSVSPVEFFKSDRFTFILSIVFIFTVFLDFTSLRSFSFKIPICWFYCESKVCILIFLILRNNYMVLYFSHSFRCM